MRKVFFLLFFLCATLAYSQADRHLYVKVSTTDCLNCYGAFMHLDKVATEVPVTLVFPSMEDKRVKYFIKKQMSTVKTDLPYIVSDSLYKALSKEGSSEIILKNGNIEIKRWELSKFNGVLPSFINEIVLMTLPDSILLNNNVVMGFTDKHIIISDRTYHSLYFINKNTYKLDKVVGEDMLDPLPFMRILAPESVDLYQQMKTQGNFLSSTNTDKVRIEPRDFNTHDKVLLPAVVFVPTRDNDTVTSIRGKSGLVTLSEDDKQLKFLQVKNLPDGIYFGSNNLHHHNGALYVNIHHRDTINYFLAQFTVNDSSVIFQKILPFAHEDYEKIIGRRVSTQAHIAYPYVMKGWENKLWNIETNEIKQLPLQHEHLSYDTINNNYTIDFSIVSAALLDNGNLRLLIYKPDNEYHIKDVDLNTMAFINEKQIAIPEKRQSMPYLYDKNKILYIVNESLIMQNI